jgi:hypothetical protein
MGLILANGYDRSSRFLAYPYHGKFLNSYCLMPPSLIQKKKTNFVLFNEEDALQFIDCLPHYKFFNDPRMNQAEQVLLDIPDEEKANWLTFDCRFEIIDGFHRKGVSVTVSIMSVCFEYKTNILLSFAGMDGADSPWNERAANKNSCQHPNARFDSIVSIFLQ